MDKHAISIEVFYAGIRGSASAGLRGTENVCETGLSTCPAEAERSRHAVRRKFLTIS
jgi:hypothetical protein